MTKPFSIAIHGGAGTILRDKMTSEMRAEYQQVLTESVKAGHKILASGGDALDAAVEAVKVMEDSSLFNAGKGSVLTNSEMVEMDASIMHGATSEAGAIAGVRHIKNPVELARDVMKKSNHVFLIGEGAEAFAFEHGYEFTEQDYFFTERRYEQLQSMKEKGLFALSESKYPDDKKYGTVGAVALDSNGNLAAATSTGGVTNKKYGRVGDSALIGCGTFAENDNVAVSTTGMGEYFIRKTVASDVAARMKYLKEDVHTASETVIQGELKAMGGEGGLIALDANGDIHFGMNSSGMYRASIDPSGKLEVKIFSDE
ncbi:Isoaspartyl peptidase [Vibrio nigripulchritudo SFn27]|uniref:Isoaspartyl peptidase n=1 Tax=Vibrio nigripulchritudo TaxID=28173 RepID=U4K1T1_9VIBR|nr:isoaspartyl peptidase/L-asparaginase [Vibrio nigripulchritudo]CCN85178.1 Isoaspartyl peptidase [Vibrio nigripulchritudo BLFn1]CCN88946.1 Isoaspartyl peptidase [Vibrio nigripulchritudo SFn27]CCN96968.1 Isoaspartyl peptidase [Vibrio nigripulchritudo ENn2]CCO40116.1 Isoaspartyl peptidase [Vibrio nigripulchritudo SFn135]CCO55477.1 Isoaspartyl peptidase [Vibrio nigripulchritudo Wn13]